MVFVAILIAYLFIYIWLAAKGPTAWDRLLAFSLVSVKLLLIIVLLASLYDLSYLLDIAVAYALLGFIGTVFIAQFLKNHKEVFR